MQAEQQRESGKVIKRFADRRSDSFGSPKRGCVSFVHQVDVERQAPLRRGFVVLYVPTMTPKGARAADVVIEDERAADLDGR